MVGRPRNASSSPSDEAEHSRQLRWAKETDIFKIAPQNPADLVTFDFVEVAVYNKKGDLANLLFADMEGPFTIRGKVVFEEGDGAEEQANCGELCQMLFSNESIPRLLC
jgi:hypothetical protein